MRTSLHSFEDNQVVLRHMNKGRSPTMCRVSRTHRVRVARLHDLHKSGSNDPDDKQQLADILTKQSFTAERWTQLTLQVNIITHTTITQSNSPTSAAVVDSLFSSVSKRARESFATSSSAKQKPVHCSGLIARTISEKNADMDYHAVPPPKYRAGGDSKRSWEREALGQLDTPGASSSGRPVAT